MSTSEGNLDDGTAANLDEAWKLVQFLYKFVQEVFERSRKPIEVTLLSFLLECYRSPSSLSGKLSS